MDRHRATSWRDPGCRIDFLSLRIGRFGHVGRAGGDAETEMPNRVALRCSPSPLPILFQLYRPLQRCSVYSVGASGDCFFVSFNFQCNQRVAVLWRSNLNPDALGGRSRSDRSGSDLLDRPDWQRRYLHVGGRGLGGVRNAGVFSGEHGIETEQPPGNHTSYRQQLGYVRWRGHVIGFDCFK